MVKGSLSSGCDLKNSFSSHQEYHLDSVVPGVYCFGSSALCIQLILLKKTEQRYEKYAYLLSLQHSYADAITSRFLACIMHAVEVFR